MKQCPKCNTDHSKPGIFCSRICANSRIFSDEAKIKKSLALKGKPSARTLEEKEKSAQKIRETRLHNYLATPFENLGIVNKRRRVFEEQNFCCNRCGINEWQGFKISLELEHKDGNTQNNSRENLEGLCPNCHSVTDTWRGRNKSCKNNVNKINDNSLIETIKESKNIRQGLLKAGITAKGKNYERAKKLLGL